MSYALQAMSFILPCPRTQPGILRPILVGFHFFDVPISSDQAVNEANQKGGADQYNKVGCKKG
jgi:hypothetical protein